MDVHTVQNEYFSSYEDLEIHKLMLEDTARTGAYKAAIMKNAAYFKNKIVMDVGCGTGILSIFCAQAGAKKVYAVEASNIVNLTKDIIKDNNFENIIEVIHSKVEDVVLPDNIKVDVIVSEWMGFYLFHEGMLDSVIMARNKFLKEDGHMFPESAAVYVAPCSVPSFYDSWADVFGVSMSTFAKHLRSTKFTKPEIQTIKEQDLLGEEVAVCWISVKDEEVQNLTSFTIQHVVGAKKPGKYQGLCVWFDCTFPNLSGDREEPPVVLSTGPDSDPTHWKQTLLVLPQEQELDEGEPIAFRLDMSRDQNNLRRYNLQVTLLDPDTIEHPLPCHCHMTKCILIRTFMQDHPEQNQGDAASEDTLIDEPIDDEVR